MNEKDRRDPQLSKDTERRKAASGAHKSEATVTPEKRPRVRSDEEVAERRGGGPKMEDV